MVKATMHGTVRDGPGVVDLLHPLNPVIGDLLALLVKERHADVPLANTGGGVAVISQHPGQSQSFLLDKARALYTGEYVDHAGAKRHPAGEQAVARGRAHR